MAAITDATTVIETLIGRTLTGPQLSNIGQNFARRDFYALWAPVDSENPTNEEYAQHILDTFLTFAKEIVRNGAEFIAYDGIQVDVTAAGDTAIADLE